MKLLILGHAEHGKTTVAEMIKEKTGLTFDDSSMMAAKIFIFDKLKDKYGYQSFEECYNDRRNRRAEWYNLICEFNKDDKAKLAKEITSKCSMYVGMRDDKEIEKCVSDKVFDLIIGVYDPNKPEESKDSFNIDLFKESDVIISTGELSKTEEKVEKLCTHLLAS